MKKKYHSDVSAFVITGFLLLIAFAITVGWVMNIITLAGMSTILTGEGVLRVVGIFVAPIGGLMGWF